MLRIGIFVLLACASCATEDDEAPQTRCEQLREHIVDLSVRDVHIATGVDRNAHRDAMRQALGSNFLDNCKTLSDSRIACALRATDSAGAASCK